MTVFLSIIFLVSIFVVISFLYISHRILNTPAINNPDAYINGSMGKEGKVLVTLGDSITHGVVSANYSRLIGKSMKKYGFQTINAGINADLAITALRKIDKVIACKPEIVTVLLGTNDVMASESETDRKRYVSMKRLKKNDPVSIDAYRESLKAIVHKLKEVEVKSIFLISLPLIGEDLSQAINQKTLAYCEVIKAVAESEGVDYVPLNESMREEVSNFQKAHGFNRDSEVRNLLLIAQHYFFKKDLDILFKHCGYQFLTEGVHLNSKGAELVNALVIKAFKENNLID